MQEVKGLDEALEAENTPAVTTEQAPATPVDSGTPIVTPDDPEFDLGQDEKGQPLKFKKSQILEFHKGNMLQSDYTKKTQELSAEKESIKEMFNIIEHLKTNPTKAQRIIAILDEKEAAQEAKIDDIDEVLKTLPEDDPYAKGLRGMKAQMNDLLKINRELSGKLGQFEQKNQAIEQQGAVKQAETALTKALDDVSKTLGFDDDDDKADWRKMVLTYLVNNPKKYNTEAEFLAEIQGVGKNEFDNVTKRNERIMAKYIKSKGAPAVPTHPAGAGSKPLTKKPTSDNLQEILEEALTEEDKK